MYVKDMLYSFYSGRKIRFWRTVLHILFLDHVAAVINFFNQLSRKHVINTALTATIIVYVIIKLS